MAHCLVTGGAGFVGSHLVEGLLRAGHQVRILDDFSTGSVRNVQAIHQQLEAEGIAFSLETIEGSMLAPAVLSEAMAGIDYVFHQAALPSVAFSLQDPMQSNRINVEGTLGVLMAAREADVKRVIYAGSSSAYGNSPVLPKQEDQPPNPLSPYAVAKLAGEHYCRVFTHVHGLETVILRYFNVFGTRQNPNSQYAAVIPAFITALLKDQPLRVFGDGHQSRDFTYVANVVQGNMLAMTAPHVAGQVINLALGRRTSLLELIAYLETLSQRKAQVEWLPPRAGDVKHSQADITRARTLLGFETAVDVEEGLARAFSYYSES